MRFEYQVGIDEYVSASVLYWKLTSRYGLLERAIFWVLAGVFLIVLAWTVEPLILSVMVTAIGGLWIYLGGLRGLFPQSYLSRYYAVADLDGRKFTVDVTDDNFEVTSGAWSWRVPWLGIRFKAEDEKVFMAYSFGTMFIFAKKYLTPQQQQEIRRLLGISV